MLVYENMSEINRVLEKVGCDLEEKEDNWKENRGWMNNDLIMSIGKNTIWGI